MNNILIIVDDGKIKEAISDAPINVFTRDYSRGMVQGIPTRIDAIVSVHELSAEISGVEIAVYDPVTVSTWRLNDQTAQEAMVDDALRLAKETGLVNNINRDHAYIVVDFHDSDRKFHCYLMFEEDV